MCSSIYIYDDVLVIDGNFSAHINSDTTRWYIGNNYGEASSSWYIGTLQDFLTAFIEA